MNDRVVIIPTYNEKENIENILRYVFKLEPKFDVLVIEDNSPRRYSPNRKTLASRISTTSYDRTEG